MGRGNEREKAKDQGRECVLEVGKEEEDNKDIRKKGKNSERETE